MPSSFVLAVVLLLIRRHWAVGLFIFPFPWLSTPLCPMVCGPGAALLAPLASVPSPFFDLGTAIPNVVCVGLLAPLVVSPSGPKTTASGRALWVECEESALASAKGARMSKKSSILSCTATLVVHVVPHCWTTFS